MVRLHQPIMGLPPPLARGLLWLAHRGLRVVWRIRRPAAQGVNVVVRHGGRLLVVRHSYQPGWGLPGGGIDPGETPALAGARELREETGIIVPADAMMPLSVHRLTEWGRPVTLHLFTADLAAPALPRIDGREIVEARWATPSDLARLPLAAGLQAYRREAERAGPAVPSR